MSASQESDPTNSTENQDAVTDTEETTSELEKYWKAVKDNPSDFTGWTYLLQYVEQENDLDHAREAFDAFFNHYPYCYGYWKKYADLEIRKENIEAAREVYERGLKAIALSIDLWIHFINFYQAQMVNKEDEEDGSRALFERAITAAGTDWKSDKLWEMYIKWEEKGKRLKKVTALYDRLLAIPTHLYSHNFDEFKKHIDENQPKDVLDLDEFLKIRQEVVASKSRPGSSAEDEDVVEEDMDTGPPGAEVEAPPGTEAPPPGMEEPAKVDQSETKSIREKVIELREVVHRKTEEEVSKRWSFESGVRRPYFHVKPLERSQLKNWKDYIEFEIENGSHERVIVLYERCLIACALYEDFWLKYARYLEDHSVDGVRNIFMRACNIHLPKKPLIHLAWAAFEERLGNYDSAGEILKNLESSLPGLATISLRRLGLERRKGNYSQTEELYNQYIENAKSKDVAAFYAIKHARFQHKVNGDVDKARSILNQAIEDNPECVKLYLQLLDLEYQQTKVLQDKVTEIFNKIFKTKVSAQTKLKFSQRRLEFLEDFGEDIGKLMEAYEDHQKYVKDEQAERRKNMQGETATSTTSDDSMPPEKKAKMESMNGSGDPNTTTAATTNASSHDAYNYSNVPWAGQYPQQYNYNNAGWNYPHHGGHYYGQQ